MNNRIYDKAIVDELARELAIPLPLARHSADEILAIVREGLIRDGAVTITHLGTFRLKPVTARMGFNPSTRERMAIPAHQRVVFTPAKALRDAAEPPRHPAVPIVVEAENTSTTTAAALAAITPDIAGGPMPLTAAPQRESTTPPVDIHFEIEPQPIPAAALRMTANNWETRAPVIANDKAPREHSKVNFILGSIAALLVGGYIAYLLSSPSSVLNTPTAPPALAEAATASAATATNFFFKEQQYRIVSGDSLWRIADVHYQQAVLWPHIYRANTTIIKNPDFLADGLTITIPGLEGQPDSLSENDRRNIAQGYFIAHLYYKTTGHKDADSALIMAKLYDAGAMDQVSTAQ